MTMDYDDDTRALKRGLRLGCLLGAALWLLIGLAVWGLS